MGIFWGLPYVRQADMKSKAVGYVAMALTVAAVIVYAAWITSVMNAVSAQMQMFQTLEGL
jgi:ABC-type Na+ efflux pump permease subunit